MISITSARTNLIKATVPENQLASRACGLPKHAQSKMKTREGNSENSMSPTIFDMFSRLCESQNLCMLKEERQAATKTTDMRRRTRISTRTDKHDKQSHWAELAHLSPALNMASASFVDACNVCNQPRLVWTRSFSSPAGFLATAFVCETR